MKAEFNSRVDLQRQVLKLINQTPWDMQLAGLSKSALDNWIFSNSVKNEEVIRSLYSIAEKLFFIANKSQDQITEEYQNLQLSIKNEINNLRRYQTNF